MLPSPSLLVVRHRKFLQRKQNRQPDVSSTGVLEPSCLGLVEYFCMVSSRSLASDGLYSLMLGIIDVPEQEVMIRVL